MFAYVGARGTACARPPVTRHVPRLYARREAGSTTNAMLSAKPTMPTVAKTWAVTVGEKQGSGGYFYEDSSSRRFLSHRAHFWFTNPGCTKNAF